jgi:(p)ppGpp synthase/HD superfamily hydrolase|tara:strand:+ start:12993 stop:13541 length:549 start_codon:yes stop_codon:yes gene_type:complete
LPVKKHDGNLFKGIFSPRINLAGTYAKNAHIGQKRKYTGEPYITHPTAVAELLRINYKDTTEDMYMAALLHDVVEDTPASHEEIARFFGDKVSELVRGLTDVSKPEDGNRATRKAMDRDHLAQGSKEVQTIKVFDLIHNTESIKEHDPEFYKVFKLEKQDLLNVMTKVDPEIKQLGWESITP